MTPDEKIKKIINSLKREDGLLDIGKYDDDVIKNALQEYGNFIRQQTLEETLAMVLKEIEDVQKAHTENGFGRISFLDTLKNKLLDNKTLQDNN